MRLQCRLAGSGQNRRSTTKVYCRSVPNSVIQASGSPYIRLFAMMEVLDSRALASMLAREAGCLAAKDYGRIRLTANSFLSSALEVVPMAT